MPSSRRRNAPIGVSRSAGRVARRRTVSALAESRLAWPRLIGSRSGHRWPRESRTTDRPGTKGRAFRGATLIRRCRTRVTDGPVAVRERTVLAIGAALYRWRSAPEPTGSRRRVVPVVASVRSGGSRVHSPPPSPRFPPATGSLCRRSTGTRPVHSPLFVMSAEYGSVSGERQARSVWAAARPARSRRSAAPGGWDTAGTADLSRIVRRGGTWSRDATR